MIESLLALVPTYGVWLILCCVGLSCLALPIPSSMLVMAAGGFSAAGDFSYVQLVLFAYCGFLIGDQTAFAVGRVGGSTMLAKLNEKPKARKILTTAEGMVSQKGSIAVILSRTIFSPIGPYVTYISGALRFSWLKFSCASAVGAIIWCLTYSWLGYTFASHIVEMASLISNSIGILLAGTVVFGLIWRLLSRYRQERQNQAE